MQKKTTWNIKEICYQNPEAAFKRWDLKPCLQSRNLVFANKLSIYVKIKLSSAWKFLIPGDPILTMNDEEIDIGDVLHIIKKIHRPHLVFLMQDSVPHISCNMFAEPLVWSCGLL